MGAMSGAPGGRADADLPVIWSPRQETRGFRETVAVQDANKQAWRGQGMAVLWDRLALELVSIIRAKGIPGLTVGFAHWGNHPQHSIHLRVEYRLGPRSRSYVDIQLVREAQDLRLNLLPYDYFPRSTWIRVVQGLVPTALTACLFVSGGVTGNELLAWSGLFPGVALMLALVPDAVFRSARAPEDHESEERIVAATAVRSAITMLMQNHPELEARFVPAELP
jgi:hypothetical protein